MALEIGGQLDSLNENDNGNGVIEKGTGNDLERKKSSDKKRKAEDSAGQLQSQTKRTKKTIEAPKAARIDNFFGKK